MKKSLLLISLVIVIAGGYFFFGGDKESKFSGDATGKHGWTSAINSGDSSVSQTKSSPEKDKDEKGKNNSKKKTLNPKEVQELREKNRKFAEREITFKPKNEEEASLLEAHRQMATFYNLPGSHTDLIQYFDKKQMEPKVVKDSNPYTGSMITIRTEKALPGTRYNHAQYMAGGDEPSALQHYSIEYRPGPEAFDRAKNLVESLYNVQGGKASQSGDFISYKLSEDYIIWIKKLGKEDLKDDPFNAYQPGDIGTIRMAIEMEIHGDDHGNQDEDHEGESHSVDLAPEEAP